MASTLALRLPEARRPPRRSASASAADRASRSTPSSASCVFQSPQRGLHHVVESAALLLEMPFAVSGDAVGFAAVRRFHGSNPALFFPARNGAVQRAGSELDAGELRDVLH